MAYGFLFGVYPTLVAECFGVHGLSQNWGCMTVAPIAFSNLFNLLYGNDEMPSSTWQPMLTHFDQDAYTIRTRLFFPTGKGNVPMGASVTAMPIGQHLVVALLGWRSVYGASDMIMSKR